MTTVCLVGCGNMGFAMLKGWLAKGSDVTVVEPNDALRARAAKAGAVALSDAAELTDVPDLIFLAVKPQVMNVVAPQYARFAGGGTTFVSVAAGVTMDSLAGWLPGETPLVRTMPNTPAAIGQGMLVSCANDLVGADVRGQVDTLLAASGETAWIDDENLMDAVTALSGSGPAYIFHLVEAMAQAGETAGLPADQAMLLARQTVVGAGFLLDASEDTAATLRQNVTSPGGTTAAALDVLMDQKSGLPELMTRAVEAARKRSVELAG